MPTKFKPDSFRYEGRGIARKQILEKSYIKGVSKDELFEYINNPSGKPKIKRKCKNELIPVSYTHLTLPTILRV